MNYSKISSIELTNFMSFKKAKLSFDETGIINIKGYNDSGKSSILRGLVVCLMDMYKRNQLKFIRHGGEYFRIVVTFDDGVSILRDKYINGQSLYEVYRGEDLMFSTKQGNRLTKIDGVPKSIADYLGMCVTDSTYLNYQSCIDRLPVVDTTGSENYQMFHEVLRMEEIYVANNMINVDKNELGYDISAMELELKRDEMLLERCGDVSQAFIDEIEKLEKKSKEVNDKKERLDNISSIVDGFGSIKNIPSIDKVDTRRLSKAYELENLVGVLENHIDLPKIEKVSSDRYSKVCKLKEIVNNLSNVKSIPKVDKVSLGRLQRLQSIYDKVKTLEGYQDIPTIPKVGEEMLAKNSKLGNLVKIYNELEKQEQQSLEIDNSLNDAREKLSNLLNSAKERGIELVKCGNCGSYTSTEGGHSHE